MAVPLEEARWSAARRRRGGPASLMNDVDTWPPPPRRADPDSHHFPRHTGIVVSVTPRHCQQLTRAHKDSRLVRQRKLCSER